MITAEERAEAAALVAAMAQQSGLEYEDTLDKLAIHYAPRLLTALAAVTQERDALKARVAQLECLLGDAYKALQLEQERSNRYELELIDTEGRR